MPYLQPTNIAKNPKIPRKSGEINEKKRPKPLFFHLLNLSLGLYHHFLGPRAVFASDDEEVDALRASLHGVADWTCIHVVVGLEMVDQGASHVVYFDVDRTVTGG